MNTCSAKLMGYDIPCNESHVNQTQKVNVDINVMTYDEYMERELRKQGGSKMALIDPHAQQKELMAANLPDELKKKIATEYHRLCGLHPNWKVHKAMRKAGEKYNIKFQFDDNAANSGMHSA